LIGVLEAINKVDGSSFTEEDIQLLSIFGHQAAVAIENARLHSELTDRLEERKEAEEALRESKENLEKAQEIAHIGNWNRDLKLNQAQWSDEMYRILGLTPGDPAQPSFETLLSRVHPADREYVTSVLKEAAEKKRPFDFEFRTVPIEGSERIIHECGEVECDEAGTPVYIFGTDQDLTETRRLQAQLQESQKTEVIAHLGRRHCTPVQQRPDFDNRAHRIARDGVSSR